MYLEKDNSMALFLDTRKILAWKEFSRPNQIYL